MVSKVIDKLSNNITANKETKELEGGLYNYGAAGQYWGMQSKGVKSVLGNAEIANDDVNARYGKIYYNGKELYLTGGFGNTKGQEHYNIGLSRIMDLGTTITADGQEHARLFIGNQMITKAGFRDAEYLQQMSVSSNGTYVNSQNGASSGEVHSRRIVTGIQALYSEDIHSFGVLGNVSYENKTINIIPVSGWEASVSLGGNPVEGSLLSARVGYTVGINTRGNNGAGMTSDKGSSVTLRAGTSLSGLPYVSTEINFLRDGWVRKVDPVAMANVFNLVGCVTAWYNAFNPQKADIPRFEVMRPQDRPNNYPHVEMFNAKSISLNRAGQQQLNELVQNLTRSFQANPNQDITLELGNYFDVKGSKNQELNEQRRAVVQQELEKLAQAYGIPPERLKIVQGETAVSPDDKRLTIHDNNMNIKIVTTGTTLLLDDTTHGTQAAFDARRTSPAGEQKYVEILNSPEFKKFAKENKLDDMEKQILGNRVFDLMYMQPNGQAKTQMEVLTEVKEKVYDKGFKLSDAYRLQEPNELKKEILKQLEKGSVLDELRKTFPNANDRQLSKEMEEIAGYIAGRALTDPTFKQDVENEMQRMAKLAEEKGENFRPSPFVALEVGLSDYKNTYLRNGLMKTELEAKIDQFEDWIKKLRSTPDAQLQDTPYLIRLKQQMELNNKIENEMLITKMVEIALQDNTLNLSPELVVFNTFPRLDEKYYSKGTTIAENGRDLFYVKNSENKTMNLIRKTFEDDRADFENKYLSKDTLKSIVAGNEEYQKHGVTEKILKNSITDTLRASFLSLPKNIVEDPNLKGDDLIRARQPSIELLGKTIIEGIKQGVSPEALKEVMPNIMNVYVKIKTGQDKDGQYEQMLINSINSDPEIKKVFEIIAKPYVDGQILPALEKQYQYEKALFQKNTAYYPPEQYNQLLEHSDKLVKETWAKNGYPVETAKPTPTQQETPQSQQPSGNVEAKPQEAPLPQPQAQSQPQQAQLEQRATQVALAQATQNSDTATQIVKENDKQGFVNTSAFEEQKPTQEQPKPQPQQTESVVKEANVVDVGSVDMKALGNASMAQKAADERAQMERQQLEEQQRLAQEAQFKQHGEKVNF